MASCPRCGGDLDAEGLCAACAFAGVLEEGVASAAPLAIEEAAERIAKRRRLVELAPVGRGGMGFVYRARQVQLDREVALKLFSAGSHERFEREARLLASLSHPHIVAIHDFGSEDGTPYIVMEYMDGPSVRTLIDMGGLTRARAMEILEQAGRAIEYAHARGVIHRDIKPENVLTNVDGLVKVGDFGIARLANQEGDPGTGSGTPAYMAPERRLRPQEADARSDIFSLGALAWEMLETVGPIDAPLQEFIRRAMDPDPNRRFQFATEFLSALRDVAPQSRNQPRPLPMRDRFRRLSLSKLFWFLLASSIVEVLGLLVWLTNYAPLGPRELFESLLKDGRFAIHHHDAQSSLRSMPVAEFDALVIREAHSTDIRRAALAVEIAYARKRQAAIPADVRMRVFRSVQPGMQVGLSGGAWWNPNKPWILQTTLKDGGPSLGRRFVEELASGSVERREISLLVVGIAWTADGPLCLEIVKRLLATPRPANPNWLLMALAARVDIPLPSKEETVPIYERFLPELLDPSGEAKWEVAARLALELPKSDELADWNTVFSPLRGGPLTPENLAAGRGIPWPWRSDNDIRMLERQIRSDHWRKGSEYLAAVMTRWHETGRFTLPHYPHGQDPTVHFRMQGDEIDLARVLRRERFNAHAKAVLLPGQSLEWECVYLHVSTLAGRPDVKAHGKGRGDVSFAADFESPIPGTPVRPSMGIGSIVPKLKPWVLPGSVEVNGNFSIDYPGVLRFEGMQMSRDPFGGSSTNSGTLSATGEAAVLHCNVFGFEGRSFRSGYAWLMFLDAKPGHDFESRWRVGLAQAADRLADSKFSIEQEFEVFKLLRFASVTPIPEAASALRRLWERRKEFEHWKPDDLAASLLMAGDATPLQDKGEIDRIKANTASRIFLFSPNSDVRKAFEKAALQPLGPGDAKVVAQVLGARGDTTSPLAREAAAGIERGRTALLLEIAAYAGVAAFLLIFAWLPRNRGQLPAIAASLAYTGLLMRLYKVQVGDVLWIPVAGDLLLLISAFLYGSGWLKVLASGLMATSILQLMVPELPGLEALSYLLFCIYLAVVSLDALSRRLPGALSRRFGIAFLATWWILIVPCAVLTIASLVYRTPVFAIAPGAISEPVAVLLAAAVILPPLIVVGSERRRRLNELV